MISRPPTSILGAPPAARPRTTLAVLRFDRQSRIRAQARGFSLIEMMVVVGIILLLVSLTVAVQRSLMAGSETRQAQSIITILDQALQDWKKTADRDITFGTPNVPQYATYSINETQYPVNDEPQQDKLISIVLGTIARNQQTKDILGQIDPDFFYSEPVGNNDSQYVVRDPWDKRVRVVFPGRTWDSAFDGNNTMRDEDGTIRTPYENRYGVCTGKRIAFISAGPDGNFGDLHLGQTGQLSSGQLKEVQQAGDNVRSYELKEARLP